MGKTPKRSMDLKEVRESLFGIQAPCASLVALDAVEESPYSFLKHMEASLEAGFARSRYKNYYTTAS